VDTGEPWPGWSKEEEVRFVLLEDLSGYHVEGTCEGVGWGCWVGIWEDQGSGNREEKSEIFKRQEYPVSLQVPSLQEGRNL
jgi:hypothetical protein